VTATVSYNSSTRVGTLTPSAPLAASTTYTATITGGSAGVKDTAGNALATDFVRSFTTAAAVTLGSTTIGSSIDSGDSNALNGSRVKTSAAGRIASMSAYVGNIDALAAKRLYQVAIYTDNAGRPGTLVAVSATGTLVANAWNTLGVSASLLPSTNYWLMFNTNGRTSLVNNMRFRTGNAGQGAYSRATVSFGTWPATFPATIDSLVFSLFATFGQ
jgi:Bacterial Ig-like domain